MKKYFLVIAILGLFFACASIQNLTPTQIQAMTTKQFEENYETTFRSTLSLVQAEGFIIDDANKETGIIKANKRIDHSKKRKEIDATTAKITFYMEELNPNLTEVKLTIYEGTIKTSHTGYYVRTKSTDVKESMLMDAQIYTTWFNNLQKEIERRKAVR